MAHCPKCQNELVEKETDFMGGELTYDSCPVCDWNNKELAKKKAKAGEI